MGGVSGISPAMAALRAAATSLPSLPQVDPVGDGVAGAAGSEGFGAQMAGSLEQLNEMHNEADELAVQAATGDLADVHEYTIKATQAELATQLTVAVRDRAVDAFNEIMRMQI